MVFLMAEAVDDFIQPHLTSLAWKNHLIKNVSNEDKIHTLNLA